VTEKPAPKEKQETETWQIVTFRGNQRGAVVVTPRE
jgi:hypothetical protein